MLKNGALLEAAEQAGFAALMTTDSNLRYQQNLAGRSIVIIVLSTTSWPRIREAVHLIVQALDAGACTGYMEVTIP